MKNWMKPRNANPKCYMRHSTVYVYEAEVWPNCDIISLKWHTYRSVTFNVCPSVKFTKYNTTTCAHNSVISLPQSNSISLSFFPHFYHQNWAFSKLITRSISDFSGTHSPTYTIIAQFSPRRIYTIERSANWPDYCVGPPRKVTLILCSQLEELQIEIILKTFQV